MLHGVLNDEFVAGLTGLIPAHLPCLHFYLRTKCSALNVDFNSVSFGGINFGYRLQNARFLLLSTNVTRERLQIDTDLLRIITSTADELSGGTNTLNDPIWGFSEFFAILGNEAHLNSEFSLK